MISKRFTDEFEHYRGGLGGIWEVWRADKLQNHFNVSWETVVLPHCFNALDCVDPYGKYYQGPGWYRKKLKFDNPYPNGRTLLHFEGAGQRTDVYIYTRHIGGHLGGYDEFRIDLTDALRDETLIPDRYDGLVPLAIRCDNSRDLETIPSDASDFNLYGGIYRYLNVQYVPAISIEQVHIETPAVSKEKGSAKVRVQLYNPEQLQDDITLTVVVRSPEGKVAHEHTVQTKPWEGNNEITAFELAEPALWSTAFPNLYTCEVVLDSKHGKTEQRERFGMRFFEFQKKGPFFLNGERLLLQGTHRHEDHAGLGAAMTEELIRQEMHMIKEMGVNFIRLGHYQQSRIVLDLCDELGILVWEEIPWCRGGLGGEQYRQQARDMLTNMIQQHYNHPSIILWGLGNENDWECDFDYFDEQEIRKFMKELHDLSHQLDDSRLTCIRRCDFCKDIVDVYSPSIWSGWYRGIYLEYEEHTRQGFESVDRYLHVEWGADNVAGRHVDEPETGFDFIQTGQGADERDGDYFLKGGQPRISKDGDWSETYFCDLIDWYLKSQLKMPWLTGTAQWPFKDFSTPVRPENPVPFVNMKGVVERDLTKKEAYYVFQSYWTDQPMARIYGHNWKVRFGKPGELKPVKVYSNCDTAELFLNGRSMGVRHRDPENFPAAGLRWEVAFEEGVNQLYVIARKGEEIAEDRVTLEYQTTPFGEPASIVLSQEPQADGRIFIEAKIYDANGVFCADAVRFVHFGLTGDGRLIDRQGTVHGSSRVQTSNGRAGIYMDPQGGRSVVSVTSEQLPTAFIEVNS